MKEKAILKTLKDIDFLSCTAYFSGSSWECLDNQVQKQIKEELKLEAIKWIKELEKNSFYEGDEKEIRMVGGLETDRSSQYWVKNWIMHFFNISEEI